MAVISRVNQTQFEGSISRNVSKFHSVAKKGNILAVTDGSYRKLQPDIHCKRSENAARSGHGMIVYFFQKVVS
jgi:hypothetical protein